MRILIAEDELLERKAMKKFIQDNFEDMTVVGEAVNGRKAIELAKELVPDIIFMDIKMPGVNGLVAVEKIHEMLPRTKFILVSAYDTFDYAKQAMQFGIKDYILKPGKREEITTALFRLRKEILNEERLEEEKQQSEKLLNESFIRKLMKQPLEDDAFVLQGQIYPLMKTGYFFVVTSDKILEEKRTTDIIKKYLPEFHIVFRENNVFTVLILVKDCVSKADQLLVARQIQQDLGEDVFIGLGHVMDSLKKLSTSYREAYTASLQLKTARKSNHGFMQQPDDKQENFVSSIVQEIEKGKRNDAIAIFENHALQLTASDKESLYMSIQTMLTKKRIALVKGAVFTLWSTEDWVIYLNDCCNKVNEYYQSKRSMTIAKEYIMAHYMESISLKDIAELVNLSPNYFSNLFKEEFGETYIEFLTEIRMEKARELIVENTYSLKEISSIVGYKDPNYFSRVFKRYYHSSPKHFHDSIVEK